MASARRISPGWDGRIYPVLGVGSPDGAVLSVPPAAMLRVTALLRRGGGALPISVPVAVGAPDRTWFEAVFRWCERPVEMPDAGEWRDATDPDVPAWLRPFGGRVLVVTAEDGTHLAGVGLKRHDEHGQELAVPA